MPRVDTECEGPAATHCNACKCREAYFATIEKNLKKAVKTLREIENCHLADPRLREGAILQSTRACLKEIGCE